MTASHIDRGAVGAPMGKPDDAPSPGGDVTFQVHDEDDGDTGTFTVKRGSRLADAVTAAYAAVKRTPSPDDQIKGDGTGDVIAPDANDTVAAYLARGGVRIWLIAGPTGGARP